MSFASILKSCFFLLFGEGGLGLKSPRPSERTSRAITFTIRTPYFVPGYTFQLTNKVQTFNS
jgi:hypothetical protein